MSERSKEAVCKTAATRYSGSNPLAPTKLYIVGSGARSDIFCAGRPVKISRYRPGFIFLLAGRSIITSPGQSEGKISGPVYSLICNGQAKLYVQLIYSESLGIAKAFSRLLAVMRFTIPIPWHILPTAPRCCPPCVYRAGSLCRRAVRWLVGTYGLSWVAPRPSGVVWALPLPVTI